MQQLLLNTRRPLIVNQLLASLQYRRNSTNALHSGRRRHCRCIDLSQFLEQFVAKLSHFFCAAVHALRECLMLFELKLRSGEEHRLEAIEIDVLHRATESSAIAFRQDDLGEEALHILHWKLRQLTFEA